MQLIDRKSTEPERLLLHAGMAAKVATDVLYASTLQLLGRAAATGPAAVATALQLLTAKGALEVGLLSFPALLQLSSTAAAQMGIGKGSSGCCSGSPGADCQGFPAGAPGEVHLSES